MLCKKKAPEGRHWFYLSAFKDWMLVSDDGKTQVRWKCPKCGMPYLEKLNGEERCIRCGRIK